MSTFVARALCVLAASACVTALAANPPASGLTRVAPGVHHTCAVTASGGVQCWGYNNRGQLGAGNTMDADVAVDVVGLAAGATAVASGEFHSCALTTGGTVWCWGDNSSGQTGQGQPFGPPLPGQVPGLTGAVAIAAGNVHTCALMSGGGVKCWGNNYYGQLGDGGVGSGPAVVDVIGLGAGADRIAAAGHHTCVRTLSGGAKCWGSNFAGELGNGSATHAPAPVDVTGLASGVVAIAAGGVHSCAIVSAGGTQCWGSNESGQLGNGTTTGSLTPVEVTGLEAATSLALGTYFSCALTSDGGVRCWGFNKLGQLGNGTIANSLQPVDVIGLPNGVVGLAAGGSHACGLTVAGSALCWGGGYFGQLGNGISASVRTPTHVVELDGIFAVAAGEDHSCALTGTGSVKCWGRNESGQLGDGTRTGSFLPVDVDVGTSVVAVRAGGYATCAITAAGAVKCWGGLGAQQVVPTEVAGLPPGIIDLALGSGHACALSAAGAMKCWGANDYGQLGNGTTIRSPTPVDVLGLGANVAAIGAGKFHSCAVMSDASVRCWGANEHGQLGVPAGGMQLAPVVVAALAEGAFTIDGGDSHTCVQTTAFLMKCWGSNGHAQLGLGNTHQLTGIQTVPLATGTLSLVAGAFHNCQLGNGGTVRCWGRNDFGEVGNGPLPYGGPLIARSPVEVAGIAGVTMLASTGDHTCALLGGGVMCWGSNYFGQIGDGTGGYVTRPQQVLAGLCGGFADVVAGDPFCAAVHWTRNRLVTLGCAPGSFCPSLPVTRKAMAALLNRVGSVFTPQVHATQAVSGALDPGAETIVCSSYALPAATYPRSAYVDAVLRAQPAGDAGFAVALVQSLDGGQTWNRMAQPVRTFVKSGTWGNVATRASTVVSAGGELRFGLRITRDALAGNATIAESTCHVRIRLENGVSIGAPY